MNNHDDSTVATVLLLVYAVGMAALGGALLGRLIEKREREALELRRRVTALELTSRLLDMPWPAHDNVPDETADLDAKEGYTDE